VYSSARANNPVEADDQAVTNEDQVDEIITAYDALMHRYAGHRTPEFLEIPITMPQAKVLYLLSADGDLHMAELVGRLGVSLSTVSGLVDRLVEHGIVSRREDPIDRRQVVVALTASGRDLVDRFRELGSRHLRALLSALPEPDLATVRDAFAILDRAAAALTASAASNRKDPS
jgi:DNA-binding MarR family transcriptional regulator